MKTAEIILENNTEWAELIKKTAPNYFEELSKGQSPNILWIGCADSRVPAELITQATPGDLFVHRNIANVVNPADLNIVSVIDYAVNALKVKHIIVCGHHYCGGVKAAMDDKNAGLVENWIHSIRDILQEHKYEFNLLTEEEKWHKLVELHVREQVNNLVKLSIVQNAWKRNQILLVHGWVFDIKTGKIKDLNITKKGLEDLPEEFIIEK